MNDIYSIFAKYYDLLMDNYDYDLVFDFVKGVMEEESIKAKNILEMACGTGKLTEKLTGICYVDAFDNSEKMLAQAYQRLYRNKKCHIFQMDLSTFHMNKEYDIILCLCDGFNYLDTIDKIQSSLERVKKNLKDQGIFIFDLNTEYRFKEVYKNHIQIEEKDDFFITWENHYNENHRKNIYTLNFFIEEGDLYRRQIEEHVEYVYDLDEIKEVLEKVGLKIISIRKGYSKNENIEQAERLVFIVKK